MASNSKTNSRKNSTETDVSTSILNGVLAVIRERKTPWIGTMTDLDSTLRRKLGRNIPENWPASPSSLRVALNRVVNRLRSRTVSVRFGRTNDHTRTRFVKFVTR